MKIQTITIIGAGNVAHHLGHRFFEKGFRIEAVYSRTLKKAKRLAKTLEANGIDDLKKIPHNSDIYILAISDDAIAVVAEKLKEYLREEALVYHSSGSVSSDAVRQFFPKGGVFYPLQTFSKNRPADFDKLPLCLHTETNELKSILEHFALSVCPNIYWVNDEQRARLHVAAVFVNNFTNHLYHIGHQICEREAVPFDLLRPLIEETALKIQGHPPVQMQTGPAVRGDKQTMQKHLNYLKGNDSWAELYQLLSQLIQPKHED